MNPVKRASIVLVAIVCLSAGTIWASSSGDPGPQQPTELSLIIDNIWILIASFLVFIMHLGFATIESGFTQARHSVNVIYKNLFILCTGFLAYAIVGFRLMHPGEFNGILGFGGFGIGFGPADSLNMLKPEYWPALSALQPERMPFHRCRRC